MSPAGVNLAGRVVDPTGQPIARANVQVLDPRQPDAIVAEVASDDFGMFQVRNIAAGGTYQVSAASQGAGGRLAGTVQTSAPDTALVIQLQPETLGNGLSPLGNRLSPTSRTAPSPVEQLASSATTTATTIGSVTINTIQPVSRSGLGETVPLSRVLPPEPTPRDDEPLAAPAGGAKSFSKEDISWDLPATGADGGSPARSNAEPGAPARSNAEPGAPARSNAEPGAPARSNAGLANATDRDLSLPADLNLDLPSSKDLQLDDFKSIDPAPASRTNLNPPAKNPSLAFAGTGLEYAKVYDLDGNTRPVGALAGDVILLDFFGSWCGPCRRAIPELNDIYDRHTRAGLRVVGVACEYGEAVPAVKSANDAIEKLSIRYPVVVSPMDEPSELREHFGVSAYPTVVLLDRRGKVLFKGQGGDPATLGQLEAAIERALANVKVAAR
jgi:thiol-disulfide isomerase/thioredoxin